MGSLLFKNTTVWGNVTWTADPGEQSSIIFTCWPPILHGSVLNQTPLENIRSSASDCRVKERGQWSRFCTIQELNRNSENSRHFGIFYISSVHIPASVFVIVHKCDRTIPSRTLFHTVCFGIFFLVSLPVKPSSTLITLPEGNPDYKTCIL